MNVDKDRRSMLKNGSRIGYFSDPQSAVCSKMCATPRSSVGVVRNATLNTLFPSSAPQCIHRAPVFTCTSSATATEYSGTLSTDTTWNAPLASFWPGTRDATSATAGDITAAGASPPTAVLPFSGAASTAFAAKPDPNLAVTPATPPRRRGRLLMPRLALSCARTRFLARDVGQIWLARVVNAALAQDIIHGNAELVRSRSRGVAVGVSGAWCASIQCVGRNVDERFG
jgi:hypothetical protein